MDFQTLSRLNVLVNFLSGNLLPVTNDKTKLPISIKIYSIAIWLIELAYLIVCILGVNNVPVEKALKDGTVNMAVILESSLLTLYLNSRKNLLRRLIGKLNGLLSMKNEVLKNSTLETVKPLEKLLKVYTIACISTVTLWVFLPFVKVFKKNKFYHSDYQVPIVLSKEPFSANVFMGGVLFETLGSAFAIVRKVSLDLYTMHLILLMTGQYKYLRVKFAEILRDEGETGKILGDDRWRIDGKGEERVKEEMRMLTRHYETVVEMAVILKKLLAPNIGILYINNVIRFCFLSIMLVTTSTEQVEKFLVVLYSIGALTQLYILCFCIQALFEASMAVADEAFYEKWYFYDLSLQRTTAIMIFGSKLECRLSGFRSIDLTLPSFMSILNQAYSVCLFFLKVRRG